MSQVTFWGYLRNFWGGRNAEPQSCCHFTSMIWGKFGPIWGKFGPDMTSQMSATADAPKTSSCSLGLNMSQLLAGLEKWSRSDLKINFKAWFWQGQWLLIKNWVPLFWPFELIAMHCSRLWLILAKFCLERHCKKSAGALPGFHLFSNSSDCWLLAADQTHWCQETSNQINNRFCLYL